MNVTDPCVIIIDERALVATVLKQLSEAIKPGIKVHYFSELSTDLVPTEIPVAVFFDGAVCSEVLSWIEKTWGTSQISTVSCGAPERVASDCVDHVIDLYESPQRVIAVLKAVIYSPKSEFLVDCAVDGLSAGEVLTMKSHRFTAMGHRHLTRRQIEVLEHASHGLSATEIAQALNVSVNTVRGYVQEIFVRLNVRNIAHAVSYYLKMQTLFDFEESSDD